MAAANSNIQLTDVDFGAIKQSFINYLQGQDTFKDYNYEGSALSVLLDVLSYNTQYNAYYLNMVANEMFLDSATQRASVISHAKMLNYTPTSAVAPSANVKVRFDNVNASSLTIPSYASFVSEAIDGVNYRFCTTQTYTATTSNKVAIFDGVEIKQGTPVSYAFTYSEINNPQAFFTLPDTTIDTTTLTVQVQKSISEFETNTYAHSESLLELDPTSKVYFLQESTTGQYEIYFGDGVLGNKLSDGNIIRVNYVTTEGAAASGANSFVMLDTVSGYVSTNVTSISAASTGSDKQSIADIKYHAPKAFAAQGRAVTKEDYIAKVQNNTLGYSFDAVNVWGGQENDPPVYGQVFISAKPKGAYLLTDTQKQRLVKEVIRPISVMTVEPTFVDPDYIYFQLTAEVLYDPKKTSVSASQLKQNVKTAISNYAASTLNTFNSTFNKSGFVQTVTNVDKSIITAEINVSVQKKFYPSITGAKTYTLYFGVPLEKGLFQSNIYSSPSLQFNDIQNASIIHDGIYIEEVPSSTNGVESIAILNPGFGYKYAPKVEILGDGTGATAVATINSNGNIKSIAITNKGYGYTSAIAKITPQSGDTTGKLGSVVVTLEGRYGTLRSFYMVNGVKTIFNNNIGTIDYAQGIITLNSFNPVDVNNDLGQLTINAKPTTTIISSTYNRIITLDDFDPQAISVNITART